MVGSPGNIRYFTPRPKGQLEAISAQKRNSRILKLKWIGHNPDKKTYIGHRYHWNTVILTHNADTNQTSDRIKEMNPPQRFTVNLDSLTQTSKPTESQTNVYTDGSLTDEHAGSGYTIQYKKKELIADSFFLFFFVGGGVRRQREQELSP